MKNYLISLFIDDEMDMDSKIDFVETVHTDTAFKNETIELLEQEKLLRGEMVTLAPPLVLPKASKPGPDFRSFFLPCLAGFATAVVLVAAALFLFTPSTVADPKLPHRFVIYRPAATQAEITGTFTNWQPIAMEKLGTSGYWSLTLNLPAGEHRYSYLVDDGRQVADPTVLMSETDDFGGENSILRVEGAGMMRIVLSAAALAIGLFACTPTHFVVVAGDTGFLHFFLDLPHARKVEFASSLDGYQIHDIRQAPSGDWEVVVPAGEGFRYFYLVDGLAFVPDCRLRETDDFGSQNCLYQPEGL